MNLRRFKAHGKLMLTGEYFVLDGAKSLALLTSKGQKLVVKDRRDSNKLYWESLDLNGSVWFETKIDLELKSTSNPNAIGNKLLELLLKAREMNPDFLRQGVDVQVSSDFNLQWGLGSSSTLVSLIAQWAGVDPYELQFACFGGSGYDIACATAEGPLIYERWPHPKTTSVPFKPIFSDQLYFIYLGKKQDSRQGIKYYQQQVEDKPRIISQLNAITDDILMSTRLDHFSYLLDSHERIISGSLQMSKVKDLLFPEYWGACKSLGAWGGDFVLATSDRDSPTTMAYFNRKGFDVIIPYCEMVLR